MSEKVRTAENDKLIASGRKVHQMTFNLRCSILQKFDTKIVITVDTLFIIFLVPQFDASKDFIGKNAIHPCLSSPPSFLHFFANIRQKNVANLI